jgi:magnesium chelatase family protein
MDNFGLSARAHDKILKIARTIADLEDSKLVSPIHIFEAITYRTLDRKLWGQKQQIGIEINEITNPPEI